MQEFSQPLGDAVKKARGELGLTQNQVADQIDVDVRTVMNIENYKGNPKNGDLIPSDPCAQNRFQRDLPSGDPPG